MPEDKKLLMVTISGPDRPGISAALTQVLMKHNAEIVDIEQASLQKLLGLYFLLDLSDTGAVTLKFLGYKMGVVTGGFDFFSEHLKEKLGFCYAFSNRLEIKKGAMTGRLAGKIIDAAEKARIVNQTACDAGILLDQTVVVGDGANDALMLGQAGLGISYNAKKGLERVANVSLGRARMAHILRLLGITEEDIAEAISCKPS